jgi:hypothetical protein
MIQDVAGEKAVTVRLDPDAYRQLETLARRERRSIGGQAAYLIEQALRLQPQRGSTKQADENPTS